MSLGNRKRRGSQSNPPKLMLTSMMDMFTIILIFLLVSFSSKPDTLDGLKDIDLPESSAELDYSDSLKIVLSQEQLTLNDEVMASVDHETIVGLEPENLEDSSLYKRLKSLYDEEKTQEDKEMEPKHVLFLCDKGHSFKTIRAVMKTAGLAGYPNFQFAVIEN